MNDEHVGRLVARGYRGTDEGQRPSRLLDFPLLVDEVLQLAELGIQHKVPAGAQRQKQKGVKRLMSQRKREPRGK